MDTDVKGHLNVTGRVQGVGYRYFAHGAATQLGLRGYVRNRWNGDVEVVVEGPRRLIESLVEDLRRGASMAGVKDVSVQWEEATGTFNGFSIRH